jgi:glucosamine--fructose-6-phosphate aminotransferase (isomerizing)
MLSTARATYKEICEQPTAWAEAIRQVGAAKEKIEAIPFQEYKQILFIGCGSTYYLSLSAAALFQSASGKICRAFPASEVFANPELVYAGPGGKSLLVAISRSGTTSETIHAVQSFQAQNQGDVITITNEPQSPLANLGGLSLSIPGGREQSVAQTKSFASMYVAAAAFALTAARREDLLARLPELPAVGERLLREYEPLAKELAADPAIAQFFFLGSGSRYGLACEASLKMKEMSLTVSEPFHFLEFRHGPVSMVDASSAVVGLVSGKSGALELSVLEDVQRLGGRAITLGEAGTSVAFNSGLPEMAREVLYLPVLQLLACHRAMHSGLNPDLPRNLTAVVKLEF